MASRINVKFVAILGAALTAVVGVVAYLGYDVLVKSGEEYAAMGDAAVDAGDYQAARGYYSRAVSHDRTRVDWLTKWKEAIVRVIPDSQIEYQRIYRDRYLGILERLAALQEFDVEAQRNYLEALYQQTRVTSRTPRAWLGFARVAKERYDRLRSNAPEAEALRRYTGLAGLRLMELLPDFAGLDSEEGSLPSLGSSGENRRLSILYDLEAAAAADPTDVDSAVSVASWHMFEWRRHRRERNPDEATIAHEKAQQVITSLRDRLDGVPEVELAWLLSKLDDAVKNATHADERRLAFEALRGTEDPVVKVFMEADPEELRVDTIDRFHRTLSVLRPREAGSLALTLAERVVARDPEDAWALMLKGRMERATGEREKAVATFEQVAALPDLPVSLDGIIRQYLREEALYESTETWLEEYEREVDPAVKAEALANAKAAQARLAATVQGGETGLRASLTRAKITLAEGRNSEAVTTLTRLVREVGDTSPMLPETLGLLAQGLVEQGQIGAARLHLVRLLELQPFNLLARVRLAEVQIELQDLEAATANLGRARELDPENERIETLWQLLAAMRGEEVEVRDPVVAAIVEAGRLQTRTEERPTPDYEGAREALEAARRAHPDDARPLLALIDLAARVGDIEELRGLVAIAEEKHPGNERVGKLAQQLQVLDIRRSEDPLAAAIEVINASDASEARKALQRHRIYAQLDKAEESRAELAKAQTIAPKDALVIEAVFADAAQRGDLETARAQANLAAAENTDEVDGLTYRARLELVEGRAADALLTLQTVVERLPYSADVHRVLGQVQMSLGQVDDAVASLEQAHTLRPQDTESSVVFAQALMQVQREDEALEVVREARRFARRDIRLYEMWLVLEGDFGDRGLAIKERANLRSSGRGSALNTAILIALMIDEGRFEEAREVLDEVRAEADSMDFAVLDAEWHAEREGDMDRGKQIVIDYIATIAEEELDAIPYLRLGQFLNEHGHEEEGLAAYRQATALQSPERLEADRVLAEHLFARDEYEGAVESYRRILDAGADTPDHFYAMRCAEALLRMERYDEADRMIRSLGEEFAESDLRAVMLLGEVARGRNDAAAMNRLADQAVSMAPNDVRPFLQRARFHMNDEELRRDVMADLEQALRLRPDSAPARQMKVTLLLRRDSVTEALAELRAGVKANPNSRELRSALIAQLEGLSDQQEAAIAEAERAVEAFPDDVYWLNTAGRVYAEQRRWEDAALKYGRSYELEPTGEVAALLAESLLRSEPPRAREALRALEAHRGEFDANGGWSALLAWAQHAMGMRGEAQSTAREALAHVRDNAQLTDYLVYAQQLFPQDLANSALFDFLSELEPPEEVGAMWAVKMARYESPLVGENMGPVIEKLKRITNETEDPQTLVEAYELLGILQYTKKQYADAVETYRRALEVAPNSLSFNNNLAYTLAKYLDDAEGALAPASHAVDLAPIGRKASALDTLGWVYLELGQIEQAESTLRRALNLARTGSEVVPANLHMAQALYELEDYERARRYAERAERVLNDPAHASLAGEYAADLEEIMRKLDRAE